MASLFSVAFLALLCSPALSTAGAYALHTHSNADGGVLPGAVTVFEAGGDGYPCIRIPSLVVRPLSLSLLTLTRAPLQTCMPSLRGLRLPLSLHSAGRRPFAFSHAFPSCHRRPSHSSLSLFLRSLPAAQHMAVSNSSSGVYLAIAECRGFTGDGCNPVRLRCQLDSSLCCLRKGMLKDTNNKEASTSAESVGRARRGRSCATDRAARRYQCDKRHMSPVAARLSVSPKLSPTQSTPPIRPGGCQRGH